MARSSAAPARGAATTTRRQRRVLVTLGAAAVVAVVAFLLVDISGDWGFALALRGRKVAAMVLVAVAIAVSTVLFQTVTHNRILTPSIMGFDSLYVLLQSVGVYFLGAVALANAPPELRFAVEATMMVAFAVVLHRWLFGRHGRDLYVLVLAGIVFGTLFSSGTNLVSRLIDPNEYQTLQDRMFASFGSVDTRLLAFSAVVVGVAVAVAWASRRELDVVALGRHPATTLGIEHRRVVNRQLVLVAVLVAVSTALVGPITFFGLLVANLARQLLGTFRHHLALPAAALLGIVALVVGQLVLERVLGYTTALSIVVDLIGGTYFLALLLKEARR
ncbi:enterobactin ABC transporter permease [Egibacter rhizosphaerae]|uniref:Enterobactin ABC transporter permease n=1 Tax=Egibacter rhizosphaerae TaxID=1670831 RepID=A0A411YLD4_9ACTN|nr:enterobactin ABC transporter permease [Egibacter rhizosphaerae]